MLSGKIDCAGIPMGMFKSHKPHMPPPPPTRDTAADAVARQEEEARRRRLLQAGLTGTMLTGPAGIPSGGELTGTRTLTSGGPASG